MAAAEAADVAAEAADAAGGLAMADAADAAGGLAMAEVADAAGGRAMDVRIASREVSFKIGCDRGSGPVMG